MPFFPSQQTDAVPPVAFPLRSDDVPDEEGAVLLLDDEGVIQHASEFARRLLHFRPQSLAGRSFFRRVHPDDLPRILQDLSEMVRHDAQGPSSLFRIKTGLGPWQWFKLKARAATRAQERSEVVLQLFGRGSRASTS